MKNIKKIISLILAVMMLIGVLAVFSVSAETTNKNSTIQLSGECKYDIAFEILTEVNKLRTASGIKAVTMNPNLIECAMQRCSEITINYDHIRPNGDSFTSISEKANAEIIVLGYRDAKSAVQAWKNSPKHNAIMMDSKFVSVGVGAFSHNGELYCVQLFSKAKDENLTEIPENKNKTFNIKLGTTTFPVKLVAPKKMFVGDTSVLNIIGTTQGTSEYPSNFELDSKSFTFTSSNTSVISTDNNAITALGNGKATITAKSSAATVSATIEVAQFSPGGSRQCGDNVTWSYSNGVLTFTGTGAIYNYEMKNVPYTDALKYVDKIVIGEGITHIGDGAFAYFEALTDVELPSTLQSIGKNAFAYCSALEEITIPDSVTTLGVSVFEKCIELKKITLPKNITSLPDRFAFNCWELNDVVIPNSVKTTGVFSFCNCAGLKSIIIPKNVEKLGRSSFNGCSALSEITFLNSQIDLSEKYLFDNCPADLIIYGYEDSTADAYAANNSKKFVALPPEVIRLIGDVDFDGEIAIIDATSIQFHMADVRLIDEASLYFADVDRDSEVSVMDATIIQMHLAGITEIEQ